MWGGGGGGGAIKIEGVALIENHLLGVWGSLDSITNSRNVLSKPTKAKIAGAAGPGPGAGSFYKSGQSCCRAGTLGGSSGQNEKWLLFISELIRKPSFLRGLSFWKKLGLGGLPLLLGEARREALLSH